MGWKKQKDVVSEQTIWIILIGAGLLQNWTMFAFVNYAAHPYSRWPLAETAVFVLQMIRLIFVNSVLQKRMLLVFAHYLDGPKKPVFCKIEQYLIL